MSIGELYNKVKELPTIPSVLLQINRIIMDDSISINKINAVIGRDQSLTANVLKVANSAYYGLSHRVDTIKKATIVLGCKTISNLVAGISVFKLFNQEERSIFDIKGLWYHSLGCATASQALVSKREPALQGKAFICGILHDIGKVIIAQHLPNETEMILKTLNEDKTLTQAEVEKDLLGFSHSQVGALVAKKWNFPEEYSETIKSHHQTKFRATEETLTEVLLCSVYVGNQIAKALALGRSSDERVTNIDSSAWETLGHSQSDLSEQLFRIKSEFDMVVNSWCPE